MKNNDRSKQLWSPDSRALYAKWRYATLSDDNEVFFLWSMNGEWLVKTSGDVLHSAVEACQKESKDFPELKQVILKDSDGR